MARDYKKEYQRDLETGKSGPSSAQHERQRARRMLDKTGADKNKNGKADKREGKDISHKKALSKGGSNKDGVTVENRSKNRARNYKKKK